MIKFTLKVAILKSGLKQTHIARLLDVDPTTFSKKIHGYIDTTEGEKLRLSEILQVPVRELFLE